jgi:hypothetical protein
MNNCFFNRNDIDLEYAIRHSSRNFLTSKKLFGGDIAELNNEPIFKGYKQPGIKKRVTKLLNDMIAAGY